ncbi:MAG: DUF4926 domain-containing protein [Cytophagaceae bacterium]|nr:DUF4926 domain-containing protein [Cytophagaceae bacterium]
MIFKLYSRAALNRDFPEYFLQRGDVVTLVEYLEARRDLPNAYVCEVFNAAGESIEIITVPESELMPLLETQILHARTLAA